MMDSARIELNVTQARKLAELLNKAEWHGSRGNITMADSYLKQAADVLKGVRVPEDENSTVYLLADTAMKAVVEPHTGTTSQVVFKGRLSSLRTLSIQALEQVEKALYTPRSATARAEAL